MRKPRLKTINVFKPYPWQIPALDSRSKIVLLTGGSGGGKSKCGYEKLHAFLLKYPGSTGLLLRKNRTSLKNSALLVLDNDVIGKKSGVVKKSSDFRYEYPNGSILVWGGMNDADQREALKSIGKDGCVDFILMEEGNAFNEDDFNLLLTRLRGTAAPWRQILVMTNPDHPDHWINRRLILGGEADVYISSAEDNPANPDDYIATLDSLTGVIKKRMRYGLWVRAEGVVYDDFSYDKHVVDDSYILPSWDFYHGFIGGTDSGYTNPRAGLLIAQGKDDELIVIDEFYERKTRVEELRKWYEDKYDMVSQEIRLWADPSDPEGIDVLDNGNGIDCERAKNQVIPGIEKVAGLFKSGKLKIHKRCVNLISELQKYCWKKGKEGDVVVKKDDHACDALRYCVYSLEEQIEVSPGAGVA